MTTRIGLVSLVGAGPGDPELLTVRAHRLLTRATVLAYDELVPDAILDLAPAHAVRIPVGRRAGGFRHHDAKIHPEVVRLALLGQDVVRLKGGDPYIFGRGGEETEELAAHGIPFEVIPGISAALAAASSQQVPLTHREVATSVTLATAHAATEAGDQELLASLPSSGTLVFYMGLTRLEILFAGLVARGRSAETPAMIVERASQPGERAVVGTLTTLPALAREAGVKPPALVVVGEVVARRVESPVLAGSPSEVVLRAAPRPLSAAASRSGSGEGPRSDRSSGPSRASSGRGARGPR